MFESLVAQATLRQSVSGNTELLVTTAIEADDGTIFESSEKAEP